MSNIAEKTGATDYRKPPTLKVNEIRFKGDTGKFVYIDLLNREQGQKPDEKELGDSLEVVFLKIRRKLSYYSKQNEKFVTTSEHNHKDETVFLFGPNIRGRASDLREQYQMLRTQQIVYCLWNGEVVRLIVKGASLGSQAEEQLATKFYEYLQSFEGSEHVHQFKTNIGTQDEKGKLGSYKVMDFQRGDKLDETELKDVEAQIEKIHSVTSAQDAHYQKYSQEQITENEATPESEDSPEYPEEDISPEDIPF